MNYLIRDWTSQQSAHLDMFTAAFKKKCCRFTWISYILGEKKPALRTAEQVCLHFATILLKLYSGAGTKVEQ